jgi:anti-sigma factor RsiW
MSDDHRTYRDALACQDVVELVTDYLDGSLEPQDRLLFEEHLAFCDWCATYLEQFRETIRLTGMLREEDIAPPIREEFVRMFRDWRQST